jgi:hypothetical protein
MLDHGLSRPSLYQGISLALSIHTVGRNIFLPDSELLYGYIATIDNFESRIKAKSTHQVLFEKWRSTSG